MLLNHFYTLSRQESEGGKVDAAISFNESHPIFGGHFPGHPVVPGVCMMQILREVMEIEFAGKLRIATGDNMKFLAIINPQNDKNVTIAINYTTAGNVLNVNASFSGPAVTFFKFKGTFEKL